MDIKRLNNFLLELDNKYDINSGACALVASMIAKYCEDHNISYKTKVYVYDDNINCIWHWAIMINNTEINPSTYEYQKNEKEIYFIEDIWNSQSLLDRYHYILSDCNYWRKHNEKKVIQLIEDFLKDF